MTRRIRGWLIRRLGGVEPPSPDLLAVQACLKWHYGGMTPWIGATTTTLSGPAGQGHIYCRCDRCRKDEAA